MRASRSEEVVLLSVGTVATLNNRQNEQQQPVVYPLIMENYAFA